MNSTTIKIDFRLISLLLLIAIVAMLGFWRPWEGTSSRTVAVSGEAKIKATPDQFVFSPIYQREGKTSEEAISTVSKFGNEVVDKLKELGVAEEAIKVNANASPNYELSLPSPGVKPTTTDSFLSQYSLTVTVNDKELAQKILDYLVTTSPLYGVSPISTFKDETRKQLEREARAKAVADAKEKAKQSASELDVRLGRVVSISDARWGGPIPLMAEDKATMSIAPERSTAPVLLTGEEEISYVVQVTFRLR